MASSAPSSCATAAAQAQGRGELHWPDCADPSVPHFRRPGGWHSVTNFCAGPVELPPGRIILASVPAHGGVLAANATASVLDHGA